MASPFYTSEHEAFREVMRRFVQKEIEPYTSQWDEEGEFPRELYRKAADIGMLGLGYPEEYGGIAADEFHDGCRDEQAENHRNDAGDDGRGDHERQRQVDESVVVVIPGFDAVST